jgi:hypothetical protein
MAVKTPAIEPAHPELGKEGRRLVLAATAGSLAWLGQLFAQLALVRSLCEWEMGWPLAATAIAAGAVTAAGLVHCARALRRETRGAQRSVASAGVALNLFAVVLIAGLEIPVAWLGPCL